MKKNRTETFLIKSIALTYATDAFTRSKNVSQFCNICKNIDRITYADNFTEEFLDLAMEPKEEYIYNIYYNLYYGTGDSNVAIACNRIL
jgi:hypothetical protein